MQKSLFSILLAAVFSFAIHSPIQAQPVLRLTSGADFAEINIESMFGPGSVAYSDALGSIWNIDIAFGLSKDIQGSADAPYMTLCVMATSSGEGTLTIQLSDKDFTAGGTAYAVIGGCLFTPGSIEYQTYYDSSNALFGTAGFLTSSGELNTEAFNSYEARAFTHPGAYSLTQQVVITHSGAGSSSFSADLIAVPDVGSSIVLLGLALTGLEGMRRRFAAA